MLRVVNLAMLEPLDLAQQVRSESLSLKVYIGVQHTAQIKCMYQTMVKLNTINFNIL